MSEDQAKIENPEDDQQPVEGIDEDKIQQKKTEDRDRLAARAKNSKFSTLNLRR